MAKPNAQPTELSQRIRTLLKEGRSVPEIMAITGTKKHIVGLVKYHMERQENTRISPATGKPVRKYTKRKVKAEVRAKPKQRQALIVVPKPEFLSMKQEIETLRNRRPIEIEVPVSQPFSHYTFWQRLRILFTGRV